MNPSQAVKHLRRRLLELIDTDPQLVEACTTLIDYKTQLEHALELIRDGVASALANVKIDEDEAPALKHEVTLTQRESKADYGKYTVTYQEHSWRCSCGSVSEQWWKTKRTARFHADDHRIKDNG